MKNFQEAWAQMEAIGYQYGPDALEHVKFGWALALTSVERAIDEAQYDPGCSVEYRSGYFDAYNEVRQALKVEVKTLRVDRVPLTVEQRALLTSTASHIPGKGDGQ